MIVRLKLITLLTLFVFMICSECPVFSNDKIKGELNNTEYDDTKGLSAEQFHDIPAILNRRQQATNKDKQIGRVTSRSSEEKLKLKNFVGAWKGFHASVYVYPTVKGFINIALSEVRIRILGNSNTCAEIVILKARNIQKSEECFHTALKLHKILGEESDISDDELILYHKEFLDAKTHVFEYMRNCLDKSKE